jgi:hypothetical protein
LALALVQCAQLEFKPVLVVHNFLPFSNAPLKPRNMENMFGPTVEFAIPAMLHLHLLLALRK